MLAKVVNDYAASLAPHGAPVFREHARSYTVAVCRTFACQPPCLVILRAIRLERSSGELMLAPVQITSATRQNLWRLTFIRTLVLAAQAGSVGLAY